jgi:hypothetical protein
VKLFHSYQATKPFSGTDGAIASSQEDIPKQALDTVAASNKGRRSAMKKHQMIAGFVA